MENETNALQLQPKWYQYIPFLLYRSGILSVWLRISQKSVQRTPVIGAMKTTAVSVAC